MAQSLLYKHASGNGCAYLELPHDVHTGIQFFCKIAKGEHLQDVLVQWLVFFGKVSYMPTQSDASTLSDPHEYVMQRYKKKINCPVFPLICCERRES